MRKRSKADGAVAPPSSRSRWKRRALELAIALPCAAFAAVVILRRATGESGVAAVGDEQCAVVVDFWSGRSRFVAQPGLVPYVPWLQQVHHFDKRPNAFVMRGNVHADVDHVPRLLARAKDGSSFWFETLSIQYALLPERAPHVLEDSGSGDAFKEKLLRAHARAYLRDELGRFSAEEIGAPENVRAATRAALERLNASLEPHGLTVLEISAPKPAFDKAYEEKIARRGGSVQEVEHLRAQLEGHPLERIRREEAARKEKELEELKLEANLVRDLGAAQRELLRARAEADNVYRDKVAAASAAKYESEVRAGVLADRYRGLAGEARKRAELLVRDGRRAVRAALVDKLAQIEFRLVPYSRDAAPRRYEHEEVPATAFAVEKE